MRVWHCNFPTSRGSPPEGLVGARIYFHLFLEKINFDSFFIDDFSIHRYWSSSWGFREYSIKKIEMFLCTQKIQIVRSRVVSDRYRLGFGTIMVENRLSVLDGESLPVSLVSYIEKLFTMCLIGIRIYCSFYSDVW